MALLDQLWHVWLKFAEPACVSYSYVDNWEVIAQSPQVLLRAHQATLDFAKCLDLTVDLAKSYLWGSTRSLRKALTMIPVCRKLAARDLGAHLVYCRQIRNATILQHIDELVPFWQRLHDVVGTHAQKCLAIRMMAWPKILHAVAASVLGLKHYTTLRSQVTFALRVQKPGTNPFLHLLLDCEALDPLYHAIQLTVRDHRSTVAFRGLPFGLHSCAVDATGARSSVSNVLVHRLHLLGWTFQTATRVVDGYGSFDLCALSWSEIHLRMTWSWQHVVAQAVSHRTDFQHFVQVNVPATRRALLAHSVSDQGVLRRVLDGSLLTNKEAWHWSEDGNDKCIKCGQLDSAEHRLWHCAATADLRAGLPSDVLQLAPTLPDVLRLHGWTLHSAVVHRWRSALLALPSGVGAPWCPVPDRSVFDFFTDGSCLFPEHVDYRVASWSVCLAGPPCLDPKPSETSLFLAGVVPGLLQTAYRAELFALAALLQACVDRVPHGLIRVWSDCLSVVRRMQRLLAGTWTCKPTVAHSDLWMWIVNSVAHLGVDRLRIFKVKAHVDLTRTGDDLELWLATNNWCADEAAKLANIQRDSGFWQLWQEHAQSCAANEWVASHVTRLQIAVFQRWFQQTDFIPLPGEQKTRPGRTFVQRWEVPEQLVVGSRFSRQFGIALEPLVLRWWGRIFDATQPLVWISYGQLFIHWVQTMRHAGVLNLKGKWVDTGTCAVQSSSRYTFRVRSKWFRLMLQEFLKAVGVRYATATLRPHSNHLHVHLGSISAPVRTSEWDLIEAWLCARVGHPIRQPGHLDALVPEV